MRQCLPAAPFSATQSFTCNRLQIARSDSRISHSRYFRLARQPGNVSWRVLHHTRSWTLQRSSQTASPKTRVRGGCARRACNACPSSAPLVHRCAFVGRCVVRGAMDGAKPSGVGASLALSGCSRIDESLNRSRRGNFLRGRNARTAFRFSSPKRPGRNGALHEVSPISSPLTMADLRHGFHASVLFSLIFSFGFHFRRTRYAYGLASASSRTLRAKARSSLTSP